MSAITSSSSDASRSSSSSSDKRLSSASTASEWSMHTVSSFIDDEIEHVDPFMFNLPTSRTTTTPSPTTPLSSRHNCPIIHIRTRSWGGDYSQIASPAPQTPLPPIPSLRGSDDHLPSINMLATPLEESCSSPIVAARCPSPSRLVTLDELSEEETSVRLSTSTRGGSLSDEHMDSFLNFDHSSIDSNGSVEGDQDSIIDSASSISQPPQEDKLSNRLKHMRNMSALALNRMPPFKRGTSVGSCSSSEDLATPQDVMPRGSPGGKGHKRGSSWTRFRERIKGKLMD